MAGCLTFIAILDLGLLSPFPPPEITKQRVSFFPLFSLLRFLKEEKESASLGPLNSQSKKILGRESARGLAVWQPTYVVVYTRR